MDVDVRRQKIRLLNSNVSVGMKLQENPPTIIRVRLNNICDTCLNLEPFFVPDPAIEQLLHDFNSKQVFNSVVS
jgi:hypothetical protein